MLGPNRQDPAASVPSPGGDSRATAAGLQEQLAVLFTEVNALAVRLKQTAALRRREGDLPAGGRSVLRILAPLGPQTVPQIARLRSTSRQNVQILVNALVAAGCVEVEHNPAHKRSSLLRLTHRGRDRLAKSLLGEAELLDRLRPHISEAEIVSTAALMRQLRQVLAQGPQQLPLSAATEPAVHMANKPRIRHPARRIPAAPEPASPRTPPVELEPTEGELPFNLL